MGAEVLPIVQVGEQVLRLAAAPVPAKELRGRDLQRLIESMRETMYKAPGVGLAAPQIGQSLQIAVIEDKAEYLKDVPSEILRDRERRPVPFHVIVNPQLILLEEGGTAEFFEGCLSLAGFTASVLRARNVRVECLDHRGQEKTIEASGWYARILQHEIDHLGGTIYIDRMRSRSFMSVEHFNRHWKEKPMSEIAQLLDIERELPRLRRTGGAAVSL